MSERAPHTRIALRIPSRNRSASAALWVCSFATTFLMRASALRGASAARGRLGARFAVGAALVGVAVVVGAVVAVGASMRESSVRAAFIDAAVMRTSGTLVTEPGGKLRLRIVRHPGTESLETDVWIAPAGGPRARVVKAGRATEIVIDNLCAGEHRIAAFDKGMAATRDSMCTIVANAEVTATIELHPAVEREIVVEYAATQSVTRVLLQEERGRAVFDFLPNGGIERPWRVKVKMPLGKFTFTVETAGGGKAEATFEMTSLAEGQPPIVLQAK